MIGRNSCTDRARKPEKTSLDARDIKESNENDQNNIPLHLKFLKRNPYLCSCRTEFLAKSRENAKKGSPHPV